MDALAAIRRRNVHRNAFPVLQSQSTANAGIMSQDAARTEARDV
jgi:hypothetical protein